MSRLLCLDVPPGQSESPCTHWAGTPVNRCEATSTRAIASNLGNWACLHRGGRKPRVDLAPWMPSPARPWSQPRHSWAIREWHGPGRIAHNLLQQDHTLKAGWSTSAWPPSGTRTTCADCSALNHNLQFRCNRPELDFVQSRRG